ncbi:MAG: hypothetical protein M0R51_14355 [Clostridia bacterium]|jgi:hypothetical protein|nr:hypothetical protein [Clostridia bacterium]
MKAELEILAIKIALTKSYIDLSKEYEKTSNPTDKVFLDGCRFVCKEILSNIEQIERESEKTSKSSLIVCD